MRKWYLFLIFYLGLGTAAMSQSCSCNFDLNFIGNVMCDDNGTPGDPSDDTFTFDIDISYPNSTGTTWHMDDLISQNIANGMYGVTQTVGPIPMSNLITNSYFFDVIDDANPGCTTLAMHLWVICPTTPPPTCSIAGGIISDWCCDDNGTSDPTDDFYTFDYFFTGYSTGTTWTATGSSVITGTYGVEATFGPLLAGQAYSWTITDDLDPSCFTSTSIGTLNSCSTPGCDLTSVGFIGLTCFDPGTPLDFTDDYWVFSLNPTGTMLGATYSVTTSSGVVSPNTGIYGGPHSFTWDNTSSVSSFVITVTDDDDPNCSITYTVTVPPSGCGTPPCMISAVFSNVLCDDNGTPTLTGDDVFYFDVIISGSNNGPSWTANDGSSGSYDVTVTYGPYLIAGGNVGLTFSDINVPSCTDVILVTPPLPCSPVCMISESIIGIVCDDNGTPTDPTDDVFFFDAIFTGFNVGSGWTSSDPNGTTGSYLIPTTFGPFQITGGDLQFILSDNTDPSCSILITIPHPDPCSNAAPCMLVDAGEVVISCNDNGTANDDFDDFLTISLDPTGVGLGGAYSVVSSQVTVTPATGNYGVPTIFNLLGAGALGGADIVLTLIDDVDPTCLLTVTIPNPAPCPSCTISLELDAIICDDNGSSSDDSDDVFYAYVNVSGIGVGSGWHADDPSIATIGMYPEQGVFGPFSIASGNVFLTIVDDVNTSCTASILLIAPAPCSINCSLQALGIDNVICDDNGTATDSTDDFIVFDLNPIGGNLGSGYDVSTSGSTISPTSSTYGMSTTFTLDIGTAGDGDVTVVITDLDSLNCTLEGLIMDPGTCSDSCVLNVVVSDVLCDDLGTSDAADDEFSFNIWVEGINESTAWSSNILNGNYEELTSMGPFLISNGAVSLAIMDSLFMDCVVTVDVPAPMPCSQCMQDVDAGQGGEVNCNQGLVLLEGSASEVGIYQWTGPNGFVVDDTLSVEVSEAGFYILSVEFSDGCEMMDTVEVTLDPSSPSADGGDNGLLTCLEDNVDLIGSLGANEVGYWYDEMQLLINTGQILNVSSAGTYYYQVEDTIKNCTSGLDEVLVADGMIDPGVYIYTNPTDYLDCQILAIELSTDVEENVVYTWNSFGELVSNPTFIITQEGTYGLTALDTITGCFATNEIVITNLEQYPFINIIPPNPITCANELSIIDASGSQGGTNILYAWYDAQLMELQGETGNTLTVSEGGIVYLELIDTTNGCINIDTLEVLTDFTSPVIDAGMDIALSCGMTNTQLSLETSNDPTAITIDWSSVEGQIISGGNNLDPVVEGTGYYYVSVIYNASGCIEVDSVFVDSDDTQLLLDVTVNDESCSGVADGSIVINDYLNGQPPYLYYINGQISEEDDLTNLAPGTYEISVVDAEACTWDSLIEIGSGLSDYIFLPPTLQLICEEENVITVDLDWTQDQIASILWTPSESVTCATCLTTEVIGIEELQVEIVSVNGCVLESEVIVLPCLKNDIYIPTAFSPNGDGVNDIFKFFGNDLQGDYEFYVFDRWGELVYDLDGRDINDPTVGWNGRFKGQALQPGVFVYLIEIIGATGESQKFYGDITLLK